MKKREGKDDASDASDTSDVDCFAREMADVVRLQPDPRGRNRAAAPPVPAPRAATSPADPAIEPDADFAVSGVNQRELRKLKRGEHAVGDRRDLHGMTSAEACADVRRFIDRSRRNQHRCVCIVHGRGLHSAGQVSVLKARVRECLREHPSVLAYTDAPRTDGGSGAVYVLLRK